MEDPWAETSAACGRPAAQSLCPATAVAGVHTSIVGNILGGHHGRSEAHGKTRHHRGIVWIGGGAFWLRHRYPEDGNSPGNRRDAVHAGVDGGVSRLRR